MWMCLEMEHLRTTAAAVSHRTYSTNQIESWWQLHGDRSWRGTKGDRRWTKGRGTGRARGEKAGKQGEEWEGQQEEQGALLQEEMALTLGTLMGTCKSTTVWHAPTYRLGTGLSRGRTTFCTRNRGLQFQFQQTPLNSSLFFTPDVVSNIVLETNGSISW